jgi:hypothetical protein
MHSKQMPPVSAAEFTRLAARVHHLRLLQALGSADTRDARELLEAEKALHNALLSPLDPALTWLLPPGVQRTHWKSPQAPPPSSPRARMRQATATPPTPPTPPEETGPQPEKDLVRVVTVDL